MTTQRSLTSTLAAHIGQTIEAADGWIGFDQYMALALYTPGLGYYANDLRKFGTMPQGVKGGGSDFVTAPEMTPLFGQTLAVQVAQALAVTKTHEVWEFGAGSGALALQVLDTLGDAVQSYIIVELSATLRERQQQTLAAHFGRVRWVSALPPAMQGVVVGNEVLDAMPVRLLVRTGGVWHERGVACEADPVGGTSRFVWQDRPTPLRPPVDVAGSHDYLTEIHPQAEAFVRTLAGTLTRGAAFFIDYGFPEAEYYHPQRHMGTVMCHRAHRADPDPLVEVGLKDITAHVNFTGLAVAAQDAAPDVGTLGYTSQARFLLNAGLPAKLEQATLAERAMALKLISEHEMGELFKVIGFYKGEPWQALGFAQGDRTPTL
ncbi:MAG: class I SAM-dependent methyltransferase [Rhodoferax sp.]